MNKAGLIERLEPRLGSKRVAAEAVEALVDIIIREIAAGGYVGITGFGTFERVERAPRTGRNPRTGETVPIERTVVPSFRAGTQFKEVVADPALLPRNGLAGGRAPAQRTAELNGQGAPAPAPVKGSGGKSGKKAKKPVKK